MEVLHAHCTGLDVHKESVVASVRHMADSKVTTVVKTFKTTTQELMALSDWLSAEGATHIAMEATGGYWKPVWHILSDGEFELVLANAAHVKNVPGRKTDVNDAAWLAQLMAHGLIRASFVSDEPTQQTRDLLRTLTAAYHMLKDGTFYQDLGADHFDNRAKGKHVLRLVNRLQNLGYNVEITPLAA